MVAVGINFYHFMMKEILGNSVSHNSSQSYVIGMAFGDWKEAFLLKGTVLTTSFSLLFIWKSEIS